MTKKKLSTTELILKKMSVLAMSVFATKQELKGASSVVSISADYDASSACTITTADDSGKQQTVIFTNTGSTDRTVTLPSTGIYKLPNSSAGTVTCPANGYCEVNFLNVTVGGTTSIYVRAI